MHRQSNARAADDVCNLHLPRLLCFHGGGSNAKIFKNQCRMLTRQLEGKFRLCFVDAPWESEAGPDVTAVYQEYRPFRRWLRWHSWHPEIDAAAATKEIEQHIATAIMDDNEKGATGQWVGLLGFSQGAKICASLLLRQQFRVKLFGNNHPAVGTKFRFGVLLAGRGPPVSLDPVLMRTTALADVSELSLKELEIGPLKNDSSHVLQIPTIHVHGMRDQGLPHHQLFLKKYCRDGTTRLVQWDGDHRIPVRSADVKRLANQIIDIGRQTGVMLDDDSE